MQIRIVLGIRIQEHIKDSHNVDNKHYLTLSPGAFSKLFKYYAERVQCIGKSLRVCFLLVEYIKDHRKR